MAITKNEYLSDMTLADPFSPGELKALVEDYFRVFCEWVEERGGGIYLHKKKGEWSDESIKKHIESNIKKYPDTFDNEYVDKKGIGYGYPVAIRGALNDIGKRGKGPDDKFVRENAGVPKKKKKSWLKRAAKAVSKTAEKTVTKVAKSASKIATSIAKNPIMAAASIATPAGAIVAAASSGKLSKMVAQSVTPKAKAYKKKLQAKIKAKAKSLGIKTDNIESITVSVQKMKDQGKAIPADMDQAVTENAAITMAQQSADAPEIDQEKQELENRIRERAARIGIAQGNEPINTIVDKAAAQLNVQLNDYIGDDGAGQDETEKLKEDVTEYKLLEQAQKDVSGGGNTMLIVGGLVGVGALAFIMSGK